MQIPCWLCSFSAVPRHLLQLSIERNHQLVLAVPAVREPSSPSPQNEGEVSQARKEEVGQREKATCMCVSPDWV